MLKVRHQLTTNDFAQRLRAPHGRCHDCARARAEGSTAADSPRHAFGADNRVADVAGVVGGAVTTGAAVRICGPVDSSALAAGMQAPTPLQGEREVDEAGPFGTPP